MDSVNLQVQGIVKIYEDDILICEEKNHIHPINFATVVARSMASMANGKVFRMVFGNGGHDNLNQIQPPLINTWNTTLYSEVYSEIIDATSPLLGTGPGCVPTDDIPSVLYESGPGATIVENTDSTSVIFTCHINKSEPRNQLDYVVDSSLPASNFFAFDEIALMTDGRSLISTKGYQDVDIGNVNVDTVPGLISNTQYSFNIQLSSRNYNIIFTTPNFISTPITMNDVINTLNDIFDVNSVPVRAIATNLSLGINTYGYLRFENTNAGDDSTVFISKSTAASPPTYLISALSGILQTPVSGASSGVRINPTNSKTEARRMITHLILNNKIQKASNKSYKITYELKIKASNVA